MWETIADVALDSLLDTLELLPFLIVIYIVIELLEHKTSLASENSRLSGNLGVLIGAATGLIPQCGFSVMAAKLYDRGYIAVGTLLAIFLSTSDEAFVILLSSGEGALTLLPLILAKLLIAIVVGYVVNAVAKAWKNSRIGLRPGMTPALADGAEREAADKADYRSRVFLPKAQRQDETECTSCGRVHDTRHPVVTYFVSPLLHSLKIALYILLVTFVFGLVIAFVGEETVMSFMDRNIYVQPFIAALIGLIPNCASSVVITQTYLMGGISFGSCVAGLCANAGLGFVVLLRNREKWKRNLLLLVGLYALAALAGLAINALEIAVGGFPF